MKHFGIILAITFFFPLSFVLAQGQVWFKDVPESHSHYQAIRHLWEKRVINGYSDNTFRPDKEVNRAEALKTILESSKVSVPDVKTNSGFFDVDALAWYAKYIAAAKRYKIVDGYQDGTFHAEKSVNLMETLKILLRTYGVNVQSVSVKEDPYGDVFQSSSFSDLFQFAKDNNLTNPDSDNLVHPDHPITRGELAELLYRLSYVLTNHQPFPTVVLPYQMKLGRLLTIIHPSTLRIKAGLTNKSLGLRGITSDTKGNVYLLVDFDASKSLEGNVGIFKIDKNLNLGVFMGPSDFQALTKVNPELTIISTDINDNVYALDAISNTVFKITPLGEVSVYLQGNKLVNALGKPNVISGGKTLKLKHMGVRSDGLVYLYDEYLGFKEDQQPVLWVINPETYQAEEVSTVEIELLTNLTNKKYFIHSLALQNDDTLYFLEGQTASLLTIDSLQNLNLLFTDIKTITSFEDLIGMALSQDSLFFFNNAEHFVSKFNLSSPTGTLRVGRFAIPSYLSVSFMTVNAQGNLYMADAESGMIYGFKVD